MRGLTIVVAGAEGDRLRAALTMACAAAALGARARVYLHEAAVAGFAADVPAPAGQPTLGELRGIAAESGVAIVACQSGLALAGLAADAIGVSGGGMIELLATLGDDRLVVA
ncbi:MULTISPECIES: DsrE family protein [unclassified Sphingomonas]|uniref:DsrE family protein n=1 Tax=unclassified Sphingomonas TaxID=196159 RepID=UPI000B30FE0F|nr:MULTISPECIES: DsrE family protein [unclassified Sphingomonas]